MDDKPELPTLRTEISFLREIALEGRELLDELLDVGFSDKQATFVVAQMIVDAVNSRDEDAYSIEFVSSYEEDEDDDDEDYYGDGYPG
jgi:hypothetical protein